MRNTIAIALILGLSIAVMAKPKRVNLDKVIGSGITATYWALEEFTVSIANDSADIHLAAYLSKEAMLAGKVAVAHQQMRVAGVSGKKWFDDAADDLLGRAIQMQELTGATLENAE